MGGLRVKRTRHCYTQDAKSSRLGKYVHDGTWRVGLGKLRVLGGLTARRGKGWDEYTREFDDLGTVRRLAGRLLRV
jgi:hypothetical protein